MQGRYAAGFVLIALGVLFILDEMGYLEFGDAVAKFWPLLLIGIGLGHLARNPSRPIGSLVLIAVGAFFLLRNFGRLPDNVWSYLWPLALILIGVSLLVPRMRRPSNATSEERLSRSAVLGGFDERVNARPFRGGSVSAFMGGGKIDLRDSELPPDGADLEANATLGGIEILVPTSWSVQVAASPFLGGVDNKTVATTTPGPTLRVKASAFMGGVEIKN